MDRLIETGAQYQGFTYRTLLAWGAPVMAILGAAAVLSCVSVQPARAQGPSTGDQNTAPSTAPAPDASQDQSQPPDDSGPSAQIPAGTLIRVKAMRDVSSASSEVDDHIRVIVASDDKSGLPTGTVFYGKVAAVTPATPNNGGYLKLKFLAPGDDPGDINTPTVAVAELSGRNARKAGHVTPYAAAGAGILGFLRKGKLGDLLEGGAIGAVAGEAIDQSQKHGAADVSIQKDSEFTIRLTKPLNMHTVITTDGY
jgi:hypothetical protein